MDIGGSGETGGVAQNHADLEQDPDQEPVIILRLSMEAEAVMTQALAPSQNPATPIPAQ